MAVMFRSRRITTGVRASTWSVTAAEKLAEACGNRAEAHVRIPFALGTSEMRRQDDARRTAIGCMLNRLVLLTAGNDAKLAELFARAEVRRSECAASAAPADWVMGADNPQLRGAL